MGRKVGDALPLSVGGAGSHLTVTWAQAYLHTKLYPDTSSRLATVDMGQKVGVAVPLFVGELGPI